MKKVYNLLFILTVMLISFIAIGKVDAMVADAIASGTSGDCEWRIDSDKTLVIGPDISDLSNGKTSCTLGEPIQETDFSIDIPYYVGIWEDYAENIESIYFSGTVYANSNSSMLFENLYNLNEINFSNFITSNAVDMSSMFSGCTSLKNVDLSYFDTKNVTDMHAMFSESGFVSLDLSSFDTHKVTDMGGMFSFNTNLKNINLSSFNTSKVTDMGAMFSITGLESLDLKNFNTANVINTSTMFAATNLEELDLSSFDTHKVTDMSSMFEDSANLKIIKVSDNFVTSNVVIDGESNVDLFKGCASLLGGNGTKYDSNKIDVSYAVIDSDNTPGYFTKKLNTYIVSFNTNGGTSINNQGVLEGEKVSFFKTTRDGYKFVGWYKDSSFTDEFNFETPITSDLTLYAKWQKLINISDTKITGITNKTYNGKVQSQNIKLTYNGQTLKSGVDYDITYSSGRKNVGTYKVFITCKGDYTGAKTLTFKINEANNPMTVSVNNKKVKKSKVKKKKQVVRAITVSKAQGIVTYVRQKGSSSKLTINKTTGKITVKKGTKKGIYKIKVKITANGNANYKSGYKVVTVKIKVR